MVASAGRTRSSSLRELMPSLVKTLRRWYLTVRGLMNSRVPISGFDSPSRASRAICASWGVSSPLVSAVRLRTVSPVASSSRAAQPFAVEQVAPGQLDADAGTAEVRDRLAVEQIGGRTLAEQGADPGF